MIGYKITSPAGIVWTIQNQIKGKWFVVNTDGTYILVTTIENLDALIQNGYGDPIPEDVLIDLIGEEI